ncbi:MAG TPA: PH domain-containing protein [Draconibacterium sp.]|nr:PH domain-containing protein [Draconibacterium sp.]
MENFTNTVLLPENLPEIIAEDFNRLDKRYLKIIFIRIAIFALLLAGGFISFLVFSDEILPGLIIAAIVTGIVVLIIYSIIISLLGFPKKGYLLREKDISFKTGLIYYKQISVTFNRIQHVEVSQGILAKLFGLSSVKIFTAGGSASDLSIPGLLTADAQKLKAFISDKISRYE